MYSEIQQKSSGTEVIQLVPRLLSMEYDDFFSQVPQDQNRWFQLHFQSEREIKNTVTAIKSIEKHLSVKGIFINVNFQALGNRKRLQIEIRR